MFKILILIFSVVFMVSCEMFAVSSARAGYYSYRDHRYAADWAMRRGECKTAEIEMKKAIDIAKFINARLPNRRASYKILVEAHKLMGRIYSYDHCKLFSKSFVSYNRALNLGIEKLGSQDLLVGNVLNDLGRAYFKDKQYENAHFYLIQAHNIFLASKKLNMEKAKPSLNLGEVFNMRLNYSKANYYYKEAVVISEEMYFSGNLSGSRTAYYIQKYGEFLVKYGRSNEAEQYFLRARDLESELSTESKTQ